MDKDEIKVLTDLAVSAGKRFQSPQTGFIHYTYHVPLEEVHHSIPLYENILFALALCRKRTLEDMTEAKSLLERLLHFQSTEGGFPVYLHEYPHVKDRFIGVYLLAPFYWILAEFGPVIGQELKGKIEKASRALIVQMEALLKDFTPSDPFKMRLGGALVAFGRHFHNEKWEKEGWRWLEEGSNFPFSPVSLGECFVGLQLATHEANHPLMQKFWAHVSQIWHHSTSTFAGPCVKDFQMDFEPQVSYFDFVMGYLTHQFSKRALQSHPIQLQGALIQPIHFPPIAEQKPWSITTIPLENALHPCSDRGRQSLRIVWGDPSRAHTFVCEGGNIAKIEVEGNQLLIHLGEPIEEEDRDKRREILFFMDTHEEGKIKVDGIPSNVFYLGQKLTIESSFSFSVTPTLEKGEGQFVGHIMKGNRPSQNGAKGNKRFNAYDWMIGIRTLRRSKECVIKIIIAAETQRNLSLLSSVAL